MHFEGGPASPRAQLHQDAYRRMRQYKAPNSIPDYLRRLCDYRQMDFEATFDQLGKLLFDSERAYDGGQYRKQYKDQWARDDPAFVVVQIAFLLVASVAYALAFHVHSVWGFLWIMLYTVVVDWFVVGALVSTACWYVANKYLRQHHAHSVEQEVEWLFAFDVHCNGFFVSFLVTYVLQYFLLPVLLTKSVVACLLSNLLYAVALTWYLYITFLGYRALPFLSYPQVFLYYPLMAIVLWLLFSVVLLTLRLKINPTMAFMAFHYAM